MQTPTWTSLKPLPQSFKMCNVHFSEVLVKAAWLSSVQAAWPLRFLLLQLVLTWGSEVFSLTSCKRNTTSMTFSSGGCSAFIYDSIHDWCLNGCNFGHLLPVLLWILFHKKYVFNLTFLHEESISMNIDKKKQILCAHFTMLCCALGCFYAKIIGRSP